ncbi:uroporphyrinogen-III synthase [Thalassomonas sp. M1454]|uniref:uroporphyrinogen-III synthase n=1 Tax=Thalassomonas sp. M1454 TaxID=2594477 RepID=UPI00117E42DB|nr:uroporphyrinogen-III synthase [Thalassomonas sp. M1454]TRX55178.1 uroporphyrinogen-III synthase [Thalassomonas sp. M1454]
MSKNNLNILLTRPLKKSQKLAKDLTPLANNIVITPLFAYQSGKDHSLLKQQVSISETIIFISQAAVEYALNTVSIDDLSQAKHIIAVGDATKKALIQAGLKQVIVPQEHTSEGLLNLAELQHVDDRTILIVRGNGGREYLKQQLELRGAKVAYNEIYQRCWLDLDQKHTIEQWRKAEINCIVITSNELLMQLNQYVKHFQWLKQCLWIVASSRIETNAKSLGLVNVINAQGANNLKIYQAIANSAWSMEVNYDR